MKKQIEFSNIPGSKKLFLDFLSGKTASFYPHHFATQESLLQVHDALSHRAFPRDAIVKVLLRQNREYDAGEKTLLNIEKLLDHSTSAVFTGQQVTIFGGPLFTFYKAALAVKLAESNCAKLNSEVIPIFWLAADDADFDEVANVTLPGENNEIVRLSYRPLQHVEEQPMGSVRLDEGIDALLTEYQAALPQTEFTDELTAKLREYYRPGDSVVTAFAKYMAFLFKDKGLVLIDPSDEEFRQLALPVFKKELRLREAAAKIVEENNRRLEAEGYHLQVAKSGSYSNLYYYNGKRSKIDFAGDGFEIEGTHFSQAELLKLLEESPQLFSPNVFLRPIVQSHLFPTLIYFAGPAEAAYFGQINELFELFGEIAPIIYPRFSATIVEPNIARLMEKYELAFEDFTRDVGF